MRQYLFDACALSQEVHTTLIVLSFTMNDNCTAVDTVTIVQQKSRVQVCFILCPNGRRRLPRAIYRTKVSRILQRKRSPARGSVKTRSVWFNSNSWEAVCFTSRDPPRSKEIGRKQTTHQLRQKRRICDVTAGDSRMKTEKALGCWEVKNKQRPQTVGQKQHSTPLNLRNGSFSQVLDGENGGLYEQQIMI